MKKIFFFLNLIIGISVLYSQSILKNDLDLLKINGKVKEWHTLEYKYNEKTKKFDKIENFSIKKYDKFRNLIELERYYEDNNGKNKYSLSKYQYVDNKLMKISCYNEESVLFGYYVYLYENDKLVEEDNYDIENKLIGKKIYLYNYNNYDLYLKKYDKNNNLTSESFYKIDSYGNDIEILTKYDNDTYKSIFKYNKNGMLIERKNTYKKNTDGFSFYYDIFNRKIITHFYIKDKLDSTGYSFYFHKKCFHIVYNSDLILRLVNKYFYDDQNNRIRWEQYEYDNNKSEMKLYKLEENKFFYYE
ncbi:MAG: hypothetical protein A2Y34_02705 [Spirochaetes bacterium GWC1_27_15]|nr:MAG: hypothetical protein A2Z98_08860 [Spirochaetes bacterium GWB1_27_13]OHD28073.1 MAG: hypothetical protein A2Y34_02705 [Spirochaetes bacterium GWC1_27_15]